METGPRFEASSDDQTDNKPRIQPVTLHIQGQFIHFTTAASMQCLFTNSIYYAMFRLYTSTMQILPTPCSGIESRSDRILQREYLLWVKPFLQRDSVHNLSYGCEYKIIRSPCI